jgi:hypothetical protein
MADEAARPGLSVEELGYRVRDVERLAALGCRLAREALADPLQSPHLQERLGSILREVGELVPGSTWEVTLPDSPELVRPPVAGAEGAKETSEAENDSTQEGEDGDGTDDDETEWELDPVKLAAALENDALISQIPEGDRPWFLSIAERAIEAHLRSQLATRVKDALEELYETMDQCHEEAEKRLATALTFEQLRVEAKKKAD